MEFDGQTFLIGGGASGIGLATAEHLSKLGATVVLVSRNPEKLKSQKARLQKEYPPARVLTFSVDLTTEGSEETLLANLRALGIELSGAVFSVGSGRPIAGNRTTRLTQSIGLNLLSATRFLDGVIEFVTQSGALVFVTSISGHEKIDAPAEYSASKSALGVMVKNWAEEIAPIRVNAVAPGNVRTANSIWDQRSKSDSSELAQYLKSSVPLGRLGEPEEIAEAIGFLLSPRSAFITGTTLTIDGGQIRSYR